MIFLSLSRWLFLVERTRRERETERAHKKRTNRYPERGVRLSDPKKAAALTVRPDIV